VTRLLSYLVPGPPSIHRPLHWAAECSPIPAMGSLPCCLCLWTSYVSSSSQLLRHIDAVTCLARKFLVFLDFPYKHEFSYHDYHVLLYVVKWFEF
jgi:hypothetical protein